MTFLDEDKRLRDLRLKKDNQDLQHDIKEIDDPILGQYLHMTNSRRKGTLYACVQIVLYGSSENALKALKKFQVPWTLVVIGAIIITVLGIGVDNPQFGTGIEVFLSNTLHFVALMVVLIAGFLVYRTVKGKRRP